MVTDLKANVPNWENEGAVREYIIKLLNKEAFDRSGLVYGMGHAVYTLSDPRAMLLKKKAEELAKLKIWRASSIYMIQLKGSHWNCLPSLRGGKELCANVDLYSALYIRCCGIPEDLYTPSLPLRGCRLVCPFPGGAYKRRQNYTAGISYSDAD